MDEHSFLPPKASHACYLLGFSPASEPIKRDEQFLLNQLGVEQLTVGEISVWFTQIERAEFEGPVAEKNLADLQWLTPRVLAHESINSNLS